MLRRSALALFVSLSLVFVCGVALAADRRQPEPGAPGAGDPYFPLDGNGGYNVAHYLLDLTYEPADDRLSGVARIQARAKQDLSSFNLDFVGMRLHSITVDGEPVDWNRDEGELSVNLRTPLSDGQHFTAVVRYSGVPRTLDEFGASGFFHTDDGAVIAGEPHVAATWYPVNDHPTDQASYRFEITVPRPLDVVANGALVGKHTAGPWTTWTWNAKEPMASYLTTVDVGRFDLHSYRRDGIGFVDAVDPDLFDPVAAPRTGTQYALSRKTGDGPASYKRLARTISVPAGGAELSFWVTRDTEASWDYMFVEAQPVGSGDWTTLPDLNGHTSRDTGFVCPYWLGLHPFLEHYQTDNGDDTCDPAGTTGEWHAVSGASNGYEQWRVDLSAYAGDDVRVSLSYASDDFVQLAGVFVHDIVVSTGAGTTSFEDDGNTRDGWTVPGAPPGSAPNPNDWIVGTAADNPPTLGEIVNGSFARQPEILRFLADNFGPYPFSTSGGIVDDTDQLGFALETQTRPIYATGFFSTPESGDGVVVHELAHQWFGDSLAVARWRHIWLNEGFASYAEWLWSEREGLGTAQEVFDFFYGLFPASDPFWDVRIGNPGPDLLFDFAVYARGAMTLHQLRLKVGDGDFFTILHRWASNRAGLNVHTGQFRALAERVSDQQLDRFFRVWLFQTRKPDLPSRAGAERVDWSAAPVAARALWKRVERGP